MNRLNIALLILNLTQFLKKMCFLSNNIVVKIDIILQEIIEAKSVPILVRICQLLESLLVDSKQKLEEKDAWITELEDKVSNSE